MSKTRKRHDCGDCGRTYAWLRYDFFPSGEQCLHGFLRLLNWRDMGGQPQSLSLRKLRDLGNVTSMAHHGTSGRVVIDLEPELKQQLYASLSLSGSTLKEWFKKVATQYCEEQIQPSFLKQLRYGPSGRGEAMVVREGHAQPQPGAAASSNGNGNVNGAKKLTAVSMFSGCGGMDLGFTGGFEVFGRRYKSLPFEVVWANDLSGAACKTYRRNLGHEIHRGDVWDLLDTLPKSADVLMGGFPCQDISVNGKRAGVNGSRSGLYKAMIEAIRRVNPKVFVAENVKALLRHPVWLEQVVNDFNGLGYKLHYQLYAAADFGVPQTRERVIFVGTRSDVRPYAPPTPERSPANWITAKEAIGDLENMEQNPAVNHIWSFAEISPEQGNRKLIANRPGYTIRAECHGNIQWHYRLPRRISMREAARFQSFPDRFIFVCGLRETERQVGNAVPPVLAWHVANSVLSCLG
jgi:DNA (cytosine-5)-methyltransferase 1